MVTRTQNPFRLTQLLLRALILAASTLILAIHSYFLAALASHSITTPINVRAVEGISGSAVLYTLLAFLLLCCCPVVVSRGSRADTEVDGNGVGDKKTRARHPAVSFAALTLNLAFAASFIFVAVANGDGAGSCSGNKVKSVFGEGKAGDKARGEDGDAFTALPTFGDACRMHKACLAAAIIGIFLFLFNLLVELAFIRHRRSAKRRPEDEAGGLATGGQVKGFFARMFGRKREYDHPVADGNMLPQHTTPDDLSGGGAAAAHTGGMMQQTSGHDTAGLLRPASFSRNTSYDPDYLPLTGDSTQYAPEAGYAYSPQEVPGPVTTTATHGGYPSYSPYRPQQPPSGYRYDDGIYDRV